MDTPWIQIINGLLYEWNVQWTLKVYVSNVTYIRDTLSDLDFYRMR
jgi:hypothetical protein